MFFPVNISDSHWTLVIVLIQEKRIMYRDSFGSSGHVYTAAIKKYLVDEMYNKHGVTMSQADQDAWVVEPLPPANSPKQQGFIDCGIFVCMYASFILENLAECFSQLNMIMLRNKICYSILKGQLYY